jgi:hypothetical protein
MTPLADLTAVERFYLLLQVILAAVNLLAGLYGLADALQQDDDPWGWGDHRR